MEFGLALGDGGMEAVLSMLWRSESLVIGSDVHSPGSNVNS